MRSRYNFRWGSQGDSQTMRGLKGVNDKRGLYFETDDMESRVSLTIIIIIVFS